jgi:hypothetical protein
MNDFGIWPNRLIVLDVSGSASERWLGDDKVSQVIGVVLAAHDCNLIDGPVMLDDRVKLLALVKLGNDDIGIGQILLRVTEEAGNGLSYIRLAAIQYAQSVDGAFGSPKTISPTQAAEAIEMLLANLREIPGLDRFRPGHVPGDL